MAKVPLQNGLMALVDNEDLPLIQEYRWCAVRRHAGWYARGTIPTGKRRVRGDKSVYMHRLLLGLKDGDGIQADHRNGNTLDNRRANLRVATCSQNLYNAKKPKHGKTSRFKGVYRHGDGAKWAVQISDRARHRIHIGLFEDEIKAAHAYDEAARRYYGEFARLNFQTLFLCAWEPPLQKLRGSHGICPKHKAQVMAEMLAARPLERLWK